MRRASHSRDAELVPLTTSFASTGSATGLAQNGSRTMTTQLLPRPVFAGPCADPSWLQSRDRPAPDSSPLPELGQETTGPPTYRAKHRLGEQRRKAGTHHPLS